MSEFTDAEIILRGTSRGVKESRDERGRIVGHAVQLVKRNAKNGIEVMLVRLPDGADPTNYADGKRIEIPVDISNFEGTMYYRATGESLLAKPAEGRTPPRPATAS
ncbi:hypothetical protein QA645_33605 [Bradyrhizobium sp. CIAT3101]|uniref:hypothetical protein n=1 Tax=Bradyrhizobium sp. CIAT3101 TaxID=439387 RepID=UPI0024B17C01|nr:hypothetical protein [Bradyrhizobium sp. CIAT3101]WFU79394.1 hypothetical protein QA645_33605 [Bradyrhizobium sp. CIAT3101]